MRKSITSSHSISEHFGVCMLRFLQKLSLLIACGLDERFRGDDDPLAFAWGTIFVAPHLYLMQKSIPDDIVFAEDGTLGREQLYRFYGHLYNGQEPGGNPTFSFLPAQQIRESKCNNTSGRTNSCLKYTQTFAQRTNQAQARMRPSTVRAIVIYSGMGYL